MSQLHNRPDFGEGKVLVPGWNQDHDQLVVHYKMSRFKVVPFYTAIAAAEDELDHHADISITYGRVDIAVSTHEAGNKITDLDIALARRIAAIAVQHAI